MILEVFTICALIRAGFSATVVCSFQTPCRCVLGAGQVIDLSTVGTPSHPRFYEVRPENATDLYSYNPCYAFDSPDKYTTVNEGNTPCKNAAGCVRTPGLASGDPPEEHAIGIQSTAKFQSVDSQVHIFYSLPQGSKQNLTVVLECDNSTLHNLYVNQSETSENASVVMTLFTKCACPPYPCASPTPDDEPSHGLSTGSKLLIAFFTIFLAYFIIGIVWNFCNGAHGIELVPNVDFWNELPKLIIEGVLFTCSCFGKKRTYGEV